MTMTHQIQTNGTSTVHSIQAPTINAPSINLVVAAAMAIAIIGALVGFGGDAAANGPLQPASAQSEVIDTIEIYIVQPGDTLWAIATEVARPGEDIRPLVDELKTLTGGARLEIGQRIIIDHAMIRR